MAGQGSLQHLPAVNAAPVYGYSNNWDRLIACRDIRSGSGNGADGCVDRVNASRADDPMFFHPQHPRSVENFDSVVAEKARGPIPSNRYPAYQLPGLAYEMRPDGGVAVRKRAIDGGQEGEAAAKKRRLVADAAR
ncbi:hypothetical protein FS749_006993 [Ceratobasidium sp. UAMH 11750]|nr:hypothetical protein FS749_006993 [Ceratobasidium sp. UAMH 11750]